MKIKFNLNDKLPQNKSVEILIMTVVIRAVFHENNKYYPLVFVDESVWNINEK